MITRIEVDGFKSLKEFQLDFMAGLNLLVGPNGSGKTNIVSFFEFLAQLTTSDASGATSHVGGAGAVFRRVGHSYERTVRARVLGCVAVQNHGRTQAQEEPAPRFCGYDYHFSLIFPEAGDTILFSSQRFRLLRSHTFLRANELLATELWGVDISSSSQPDGTTQVTTNAFDDSLLDLPYYPTKTRQKSKPDADRTLDGILSQLLGGGTTSLVPIITRYTPELWAISEDFTGGQIYNVVPSKLKLPEDSSRPPGIARDGSGLASTLYALQRSRNSTDYGPWAYYQRPRQTYYDPKALDHLKGYLGLVNSAVQDINVENDPFDNQLRVRFVIKSGEYQATLPMGLMSDGTLKWLAIVAAAVTARSVFCIEEPENYLHPQMQGQIVTILREILFQEGSQRFTLMTTHSETLLNRCLPEELILVSMVDGRTEARRSTNAAEISDEISRTGFGLGYYYIANAIQND